MILAGLVLLAVGASDLVRQFVPRRWIGFLIAAITLVVIGTIGDALVWAFVAIVAGVLWVWAMPESRRSAAGFWPAVALAVVCIAAVLWLGERTGAGLLTPVWRVDSPIGPVSFDLVVLTFGAAVFLLESGNRIVRSALSAESAWRPVERASVHTASDGEDGTQPAARPSDGFQGGRLIGPLERILVLVLTLVGAYALLAAMLAAKGIVRFPEISRDGETGARAEYFLVGSLVSWVVALGAAFLVWWCALS
ncbi:hypothetical protein HD600_000222 [Microbacterium ginsengiterrae]|uniref:Uncharacterized protein n=1 Tax=Microbacterium ginsengiterrae TaxID=546115 RepID=A0A7W9CA02_9MICO|nr:hypothetical protein [Microbacterium ginsengiterrae]MBB5741725.1 hypothetical protein [Microbacterium ginsengiterrae]